MANNNIKPLLLSNTSSESNISENMKNNEISIVVSEDKVRSIKVHFGAKFKMYFFVGWRIWDSNVEKIDEFECQQ